MRLLVSGFVAVAAGCGARINEAGPDAAPAVDASIAPVEGWLPCAVQGAMCTFERAQDASVQVRYGKRPDDGGINTTQVFDGVKGVLCDNATFGGNPNPTAWETNFCWYWGPLKLSEPVNTFMRPEIHLPVTYPAFPGFTTDRVKPTTAQPTADGTIGAFRVTCGFSHFSFDDPVVFPNQPGKSHLHTYFGNTTVDASTTPTAIGATGSSTCAGGTLNHSGYWVPAMIDTATHQPIPSTVNNVYYKSGYNGIAPSAIHPVPEGLVMISGSGANTLPGVNPVRYSCLSATEAGAWQATIPSCPGGSELLMEVTFPQCWDGVHLDSADHKSHMASPRSGACPTTHPIAIPVVSYNIHYDVPTDGATLAWALSSDDYDTSGGNAGNSGHGDYVYGWDRSTIETFTTRCINAAMDCHDYLLGDGRTLY